MKKLLFLAVVAAAAWYAWTHYGPKIGPPASSPDTTPAASAKHRIDTLSGAAPE